jgi:metal-sulfur cluster biosynthetic enzyme
VSAAAATTDAARVHSLLSTIQDPCSVGMGAPIDIVGMGLVEEVRVDEKGGVLVRLVLTQPTCFYFWDLRTHIVDTISAEPGVTEVEVEVVKESWTPERMSPERRLEARRRRAAALGLTLPA